MRSRSPSRASLAVVRGASAVGAVALTLGATLAAPGTAAAAPAPCERAEEYGAQSGAELLHIEKLDGGERGRVSNVGLAQARSALVAPATVNSAAVTRLLDADRSGAHTEPLIQQAPPTNATPARRSTDAGDVGPFALGSGTLTSHAQWDPRMACRRSAGEVTRAEAAVHDAGIGELLRTTQKIRSRSTTALVSGGRTVAAAGLSVTTFDLLGGAIHVKVLRAPSLVAEMSTKDGGSIRYVPAILQVSGDGVRTTRLDKSGDEFELALDAEPDMKLESSTLENMTGGRRLPLPTVPGIPSVGGRDESARVTGPGTRLRIALGQARQAAADHAIAAKATAIRIAITQAPPDVQGPSGRAAGSGRDGQKNGYGGSAADHGRVVLDLRIGLLEAAVVASEPGAGRVGAVSAGGAGAGLPITGPRVGVLALSGAALVAAGALAFGVRRRRFQP
jgi:hypothetical protein